MMRESKFGILAILSILSVTLWISFLRDDYSHSRHAYSELGELNSPYFLIFNIFAFILPSILILYSVLNMHKILLIEPDDTLSFKIALLGWLFIGIFPLSYSISWLYWIHIISAFVAFVFGPLWMVKISILLSSRTEWVYFSLFSTIIAFLIWGVILLGELFFHAAVTQITSISLFFLWYLFFVIKIEIVNRSQIAELA